MNSGHPSANIERKLVGAWRRERLFVDLRGVFHLTIWIATLLAIDLAIDWMLNLSGTGRVLLLAISLLILLMVGYLRWARHIRRYDPLRIALQVEGCNPDLKSILVSYVQLRDRADREDRMSPTMVRAMCDQAAAVTARLDFGAIVLFRALRPLLIGSAVVVLVVGATAWHQRAFVEVFLGRMLDPASKLRYPTRTLIEPVTEDSTLQEGRTFSPAVLAGGEIPKEASLTIRPVDGESGTITIPVGKEATTDGKRAFTYHMGEVYHSFTYWFRVGDAVSDHYRVTVVPPPQAKATLTLNYPEYTRLPPNTTTSLTTELLERSRIEWSVEFDRPLAGAEMIPHGGRPVPMILEREGRAARLSLGSEKDPFLKSLTYGFRWKDLEHGFTYAPASQYVITVVPDRPPRMALTSPSRDLIGWKEKVLKIRLSATDDYGLTEARFIYSVENGKEVIPETTIPITTTVFKDQPLEARVSFDLPLYKAIPGLKEGDVIRYAIEVIDNSPGKPSVSRSETRRIDIVSRGEYVKYVQRETARLVARIRELHAVEDKESEMLDEELKDLGGDVEKDKRK